MMASVLPMSKSHMPEILPRNLARQEHRRSRNICQSPSRSRPQFAPMIAACGINVRSRTSGFSSSAPAGSRDGCAGNGVGTAAFRPSGVRPRRATGRRQFPRRLGARPLRRGGAARDRRPAIADHRGEPRTPGRRGDRRPFSPAFRPRTPAVSSRTRSTISSLPTSFATRSATTSAGCSRPMARSAIPASA